MGDENSIHSENSVDNTNFTQKQYLSVLIKTWATYPELWNTSSEGYRIKVKKNNALEKLLDIYKKKKSNQIAREKM